VGAALLSLSAIGCVSIAVASLLWRVRSQRVLSATALLSKTVLACVLSALGLVTSFVVGTSAVMSHLTFEDETTLRFVIELSRVSTKCIQATALPLGIAFFLSALLFASDIRTMIQDGWRSVEALPKEGQRR